MRNRDEKRGEVKQRMKEEEYNDGKDMKNENRKDGGIFFKKGK